jgi:hypothetical protein
MQIIVDHFHKAVEYALVAFAPGVEQLRDLVTGGFHRKCRPAFESCDPLLTTLRRLPLFGNSPVMKNACEGRRSFIRLRSSRYARNWPAVLEWIGTIRDL